VNRNLLGALALLAWVLLMAFFFSQVEIQIEGARGWAAALPTWRVEHHPLLDLFWGGRPLTGYHAWVFSFMALAFHLPHFLSGRFSLRTEARCLGCLMLFWIAEDFLWFALNPAFGVARLAPQYIPWHTSWTLGLPTDYLTFSGTGLALLWYSYQVKATPSRERAS
jgi:hypothetical protein